MDRARRAGLTALIVVVMVASAAGARWLRCPGRRRRLAAVDARRLRGADWRCVGVGRVRRDREPGRSRPVDLLGLEVVYATSSGSTVTRKATWATSTIARARASAFLLGNGSGVFGSDRRRDLFGRVRGDRWR